VYTFRTSLSLGYDYLETGAGGYNLAQSRSHSTFLTSNLRLRRNLSIGLNGSLAQRRFSGGAFDDDQLAWRVGGYTSFELPAGQARVEIFSSELNSEFPTNSRELRGIWTTFNWRLPEKLRLTNELRVEWNNDLFGDTRRDELATQLRYDLMDNFSWGVNATMFATTRDVFGRDRGFGFSTDARWNFLPNWYASVIANYNTEAFESDPTGLLARSRTSERNTFWLTIGYARASGRPHSTYGKKGSGFGAGSVAGQVFFDENLDGIRQPGEKPAAGAVVLLDGRYETRTDYQGRYFFKPVPTGEHEVTILTEELPLPWGLQDERPRQVKVGFRDTAALDFALQRIN
jgi:hypothetical protein